MKNFKLFGLSPAMCVLLVACGGGGSSTPEPEPPVANLAPVISGSQSIDVLEGAQLSEAYSFSDPENGSITTSLSGDDAGLMELSSAGNLTFMQVPDFEVAADSDANNVYDINVVASDGVNDTPYPVVITVSNATEGRVVDGPLSGSVVFVDINGDGVQDSDEPTGTTDDDGYFSFAESTTLDSDQTLRVVAVGGTDTQTGVALDGLTLFSEISTSADDVAVTPLTTVLVGLPDDAQKVEFLAAIGIDDTPMFLLTSDGWAAAQSGDAAAKAAQRASQQIAVVLQGVSALTADNVAKTAIEQTQVVAAKIAKVSQDQANFSLISSDSVFAIIGESVEVTAPGVYTDTALLTSVAASVAAVNTVVSDISIDPTSVLASEVALAVQVDMQASLDSLASGDTDTATYTAATVLGTLLANVTIPADAADQDGDGIADILDEDNDGDGVIDIEDDFPNDETETTDDDGDGIGNNMDEDVPPVITLNGAAAVNHEQGTTYIDAGAVATDTVEGILTVIVSGAVDSATAGSYTLTYSASDSAGNAAIVVTRTVTVADTVAPVITLAGSASVNHEQGTSYTDLGATASDTVGGAMSVTVTGDVDTETAGIYTLTYTVTDLAGNTATAVTRTVTVVDTSIDDMYLVGASTEYHEQGTEYVDEGVIATDVVDGVLDVVTTGDVDSNIAGTYTLTFTATDNAGNERVLTRTVIVSDTIAPDIVFQLPSALEASADENGEWVLSDEARAYILGALSAVDIVDGSVAITDDMPNTFPMGATTVTITATDATGNTASFFFTLTVFDDDGPQITGPAGISVTSSDGLNVPATNSDIAAFLSGASSLDNVDGAVTVSSNAPSGGFPIGATTVTFTAVDAAGNTTTYTAVVTIVNGNLTRAGYKLPTAITVLETVE